MLKKRSKGIFALLICAVMLMLTAPLSIYAEEPNTDIVIIPSDANALVLMDVGAQAPKGAPGDTVTIMLPMAVNKEYLPSERYLLRNINISPAIPTDTSVTNWPFDITDASNTRHLQDMTFNSTAEVSFNFRISEFAKKGVYPVNFKVNATVWREDDVNGTTITEDVTFNLCVYVTVTDDGNLSGVTTSFGCLQVAGTNITGAQSIPTASPGQNVTLKIPVINVGGDLTNVTVTPVASTKLDEFPFVVKSTNMGKTFNTWKSQEIKTLEYTFTVAQQATSGTKVIRLNATYFENGSPAEGSLSTQLTIVNGYVEPVTQKDTPTAMSVMVESYKLYIKGVEVSGLMAGEEAELVLIIRNNSTTDTANKILTNLNFTNSPDLSIAPGSNDSAYIDSIGPGGAMTETLRIMAKPDAEAGYSMLGIGLTYEGREHSQGSANQNIMIPISQKMELQLGTPSVYGKQIKGKEGTISIPITNTGRGKALNVKIVASDGLSQPSPCYVGDIPAGGSVQADVAVVYTKTGQYSGTLIVQYEDANGQLYMGKAQPQLDVADPENADNNNNGNDQNDGNGRGGNGYWARILWPIFLILLLLAIAALIILLILIKKGKLTKKASPEEEDDEPDWSDDEF
ncbi:MAG: hypothetical protein IKE94_11645 [Aeriscardovia sp.]|nr:hypothetical protein [Aeriscardovia sp.]MBR3262921.1 hypothetical protein [Lachnospiraceae bacterium]MBR3359816.1 hypothetical protein [Lachnospiraceae bacterium]